MLYRTARKIVFALMGSTLVLVGVALLVLPGPGVLTIMAGFAVLAVEFAWARLWLRKMKKQGKSLWDQVRGISRW